LNDREYVREFAAQNSWEIFNSILKKTSPGNDGYIGFYFKEPEITPRAKPGIYRFDNENKSLSKFDSTDRDVR
jgi:xylulokinase